MRLAAAAVLLAAGLSGCAAPPVDDRLAWDVANCRRHAKEGPGGPSPMVGTTLGTMSAASRRRAGIAAAALLSGSDQSRLAPSRPQDVYADCMRVRGHLVPLGPQYPLPPGRIG